MDQKIVCDPWLTEVLSRDVYSVPGILPLEAIEQGISSVIDSVPSGSKVFIYAKAGAEDQKRIQIFSEHKFELVDVQVTFEKIRETFELGASSNVRNAVPADEEAVCHLAATCFSQTRFHRDPQIGNVLANQIKEAWVRSYFRKTRGIGMLLAVDRAGDPQGFLLLLMDKEGRLIIDLIGVASKHRGQGMGQAMIIAAMGAYPQASVFRAGTQLVNRNSIRLYEGLGFRFCEAQYIFHRHEEGKAGL
jgi:ribosomal protein S18 acetylase RimI-like enzyme